MRWAGVPHHTTTLAACTVAYFGARIGQVGLSPIVPAVTTVFDVSTATIGIALSGMWVAYACTQVPSSLLAARVGPRTTVLTALGVGAATLVVVAAAPIWPVFFLGVVVLGAGAGLYYNAAASLLATEVDSVGSALGVHKLGSRAAGMAAPALAAALLARYSWRTVPLAAAGLAVVGLGTVRAVVPRTPPTGDGSIGHVRELVAPLARPAVARVTAFTAVGEFVELATMSLLPAALVAHYDLGIGAASGLFGIHFVVAALVGPVTGYLADVFDGGVGALTATLSGVVGFAGLAVGAPPAVAVAFTGASMGWTAPLQSRALDAFPEDDRDRGFGVYRMAYLLVGALGSGVVGSVATVAGWTTALALLAALLGVVSVGLVLERTT